MSILNELMADVAALFVPPRCPVCGEPLLMGERAVCSFCRATAPLTGFWREADNPVASKFWGLVPVYRASGFLYYLHGSGWRQLIHGFKYRGAWRTARAMGEWYGRCLAESGLYDDVDVVVPLPLHPLKRCRRGYNQSEYIAEGIAAQLGVEVDRRSVRRKRNTASQALKPRRERARNVEDAFAVRHPDRLEGRHVLLVDDVMTTGSTLAACASAILQAAPGCRVSVAALAVSRRELGVKA
ncbi:ComF family protein [Alistipes sp.]|uniref:ComF family protein n=1 Tax=Alistipes sp. TaxID=1872444 RepID=UPI003AEF717F